MVSLSPAFAQLPPGWRYLRYDLNGSNYFPFPSTVQTKNKYDLKWTAAIGLGQPVRPILTGDVNGDGNLEIVHVVHTIMKILDINGKVLKEVTLGSKDCVLSFLDDFNGDDIPDIFVQTANDPQMRIYIYDGNGNLLSNIEKSSSGDPDICAWAFLHNEKLIVNYKGRTGNNSRGLACWKYNSVTREWFEYWYYSIGPAYSDVSIADADQDGKYEITLSTVASSLGDVGTGYNNNGTSTPDNQVYTVVVDEDGNEEFTLDYGGEKAFLYNYFIDFDHDGKFEILAVECHGQFMGSFPGTSKLHIIDYNSRAIIKTFYGSVDAHWSVAFADVNNDGIDEIIASNIQTGSFAKQYILDSNLNILKSSNFGGYITSINDINGDGKLEIFLKDESIIKILDNELNLLWSQQLGGKIYYAIFSDLDKNDRNELLVTADKLYNFEGDTLFPDIELSEMDHYFGDVPVNNTNSFILYIENVGQGLLNVANITNNKTAFAATPRSASIQPGESEAITLSFTPTHQDFYQDTFYVYSNDPDEPVVPFPVSGEGVSAPAPIIFLPVTSHDFKDVPVLTSSTWIMKIENRGETTLMVDNIESNNPVFTVSPINFELAPNSNSYQVEVKFIPITVELDSGTLTISSNDSDNPKINVKLKGKGVDYQPPEIIPEPITQNTWLNSDYPITAQVSDNWRVSYVQLNYRKGSDKNFKNITMNPLGNDIYHATIPASEITFEGIAYFIQAEDSAGNKDSSNAFSHEIYFPDGALATSGPNSHYSSGFPRGQWNMLSIPAVVDEPNVGSILTDETELGSYGEPNWRFFSYEDTDNNGITDGYIEYVPDQKSSTFQFVCGKAFWLKANPDGSKIEIDVGAGYVLPLQPQTISLRPGWNQIGSPFAFPINFSPTDINIVNQLYLPNGNGSYQLTTTMRPWTGYFVYVNGYNNVNLVLNHVSSNPLKKIMADSDEWDLQIGACCGNYKDDINYLGVNKFSSDALDSKDLPEPPVIGDYISLYFPHLDWKAECSYYTSDFRYRIEDGQIWNFNVRTNQISANITLHWGTIVIPQSDLKFILYDITRNRTIDMKLDEQYIYSRSMGEDQSAFKIIVGKSHFIEDQLNEICSHLPDRFYLFQNYPNPFNTSTIIPFEVSSTTKVKLMLYNTRGEAVAMITNKVFEAGYHEITFDATNLTSGLFFYKLEAEGFEAVKKFIVLK